MAIGSTNVPYRSKARTSRPFTPPAGLSVALATGDRQEEPGEVLIARTAGQQVGGDPRVARGRVLTGGHEVDVAVQDGHRLVAADIARVGPQEALQSLQVTHH